MNLIVDTNVLISALIKDSITRKLIVHSKYSLLIPELGLEEIENHKQEILEKSNLAEREFERLLYYLLKYLKIIRTGDLVDCREEANQIMGHIDKDDVIFFAAALAFNCPIWSDDLHFRQQKRIKILTTQDLISDIK